MILSRECFCFEFCPLIEMHTHLMEVLLIHVTAVTSSQWFTVTNLLVYHNDIHGLANGLFQAMLKCYYNHKRHTWCYTYFELKYCFFGFE